MLRDSMQFSSSRSSSSREQCKRRPDIVTPAPVPWPTRRAGHAAAPPARSQSRPAPPAASRWPHRARGWPAAGARASAVGAVASCHPAVLIARQMLATVFTRAFGEECSFLGALGVEDSAFCAWAGRSSRQRGRARLTAAECSPGRPHATPACHVAAAQSSSAGHHCPHPPSTQRLIRPPPKPSTPASVAAAASRPARAAGPSPSPPPCSASSRSSPSSPPPCCPISCCTTAARSAASAGGVGGGSAPSAIVRGGGFGRHSSSCRQISKNACRNASSPSPTPLPPHCAAMREAKSSTAGPAASAPAFSASRSTAGKLAPYSRLSTACRPPWARPRAAAAASA